MTRGCVTLGDLRVAMLEIRCERCHRMGRLRTDRLFERYGADMGLPALRWKLAGDCPRNDAADFADRCRVYYPQLLQEGRDG